MLFPPVRHKLEVNDLAASLGIMLIEQTGFEAVETCLTGVAQHTLCLLRSSLQALTAVLLL